MKIIKSYNPTEYGHVNTLDVVGASPIPTPSQARLQLKNLLLSMGHSFRHVSPTAKVEDLTQSGGPSTVTRAAKFLVEHKIPFAEAVELLKGLQAGGKLKITDAQRGIALDALAQAVFEFSVSYDTTAR